MAQKDVKNFWKDKKVVVTGGAGFIGSHLTQMLLDCHAYVTVISKKKPQDVSFLNLNQPRLKYLSYDLTKINPKLVTQLKNQDMVFHLAAKVTGIGFNINHHATMLRENLTLTLNILEASRLAGIKRFQYVSSACVYPRYCSIPTPEKEGFKDDPEPTNYGYGWAKRMGEVIAKTYAQEYGMSISIVRPYNCYGPKDNFNLKTSHVIPAIIRRITEGENPVIVWGDGSPTRAFIYVEDLARGLKEAMEAPSTLKPINIGTDKEISIKELISLIIKISGVKTKVKYDPSKPNGQPRRSCDTTRAKKHIGFSPKISLEEGIKRTILWYNNTDKNKLDS